MNTRKIKVIAYVLHRYLQGYKLLKNVPGTPGTNVKMLQKRGWMESATLDIHDWYTVLSADFSGTKKTEVKEMLFCTKYAFFDNETHGLTYRKEITYYKMGDTPTVRAIKGLVPLDVWRGRNLDHVDRPVARIKEDRVSNLLHLGLPIGIETVEKDKTFGEYVVDHFYKQKYKADFANLQFRQGFFKTLRDNLSR